MPGSAIAPVAWCKLGYPLCMMTILGARKVLSVLVWCPLPMLLLAHIESGTEHFSLGLSPNLEAEEKMWWGVGRGLDSAMRSRDDLRRQARTLFPGQ